MANPPGNKITIEYGSQKIHIEVLDRNFGKACSLLLFSILWNGALGGFAFFLFQYKIDFVFIWILFFVIFGLIGIWILLVGLFRLVGKTDVVLDTIEFQIRKSLFGVCWSKKSILTPQIEKVELGEAYRFEDVPDDPDSEIVYAIAIRAGLKVIMFGTALSDEEKNWLIDFINHSLQTMRTKGKIY